MISIVPKRRRVLGRSGNDLTAWPWVLEGASHNEIGGMARNPKGMPAIN